MFLLGDLRDGVEELGGGRPTGRIPSGLGSDALEWRGGPSCWDILLLQAWGCGDTASSQGSGLSASAVLTAPPLRSSVIPSQLLHKTRTSPACGLGVLMPRLQSYWGLGALQGSQSHGLTRRDGDSRWAVMAPRACALLGTPSFPLPT